VEILSVTLENFRSHTNSHFDFTPGVNLLIGNNGAGKSSVLEAIGFALFDAKTRTANKDIVRRGATSAKATVSFIGNDGNTYRVERKAGSGASWKLFVGTEKTHRYTGTGEVSPVLKELTGVTDSEIDIFADVICAVQNRFTEIFTRSDTEREKLFDKNGDGIPDATGCFMVAGRELCDVPIINSTDNNGGNFTTGILWDSGDGGTEYNGTQVPAGL